MMVILAASIRETEASINPRPELRVRQMMTMEEPASALFSFCVVLVSVWGLWNYVARHKELRAMIRRERLTRTGESLSSSAGGGGSGSMMTEDYPYHWLWYVSYACYIMAFGWSFLFHWHETLLRRNMDYFCAVIAFSVQVIAAFVRVFEIKNRSLQILIAIPVILRDVFFVHRQLFVKWSYSFAVDVATQFIIIETALFVPWSLWAFFVRKLDHAKFVIATHALLGFFVLFELYDFIPLFGVCLLLLIS